jgi:hypothetical protein
VHIFNWAFTEGGENSLVSRWSRKGGGREQADEEEGGAEDGKGNHGDAKGLIRSMSYSHRKLGGRNAQK